jgi:hypothetical protein
MSTNLMWEPVEQREEALFADEKIKNKVLGMF